MNKPYTIQSDMWSIGVCLYELLYNKLPFTSDSLEELSQMITIADVVYPKDIALAGDLEEL